VLFGYARAERELEVRKFVALSCAAGTRFGITTGAIPSSLPLIEALLARLHWADDQCRPISDGTGGQQARPILSAVYTGASTRQRFFSRPGL